MFKECLWPHTVPSAGRGQPGAAVQAAPGLCADQSSLIWPGEVRVDTAAIPMEGPALPGQGSFSWPLPAPEAFSLHQEGGAADRAGHREARRAAGRGAWC